MFISVRYFKVVKIYGSKFFHFLPNVLMETVLQKWTTRIKKSKIKWKRFFRYLFAKVYSPEIFKILLSEKFYVCKCKNVLVCPNRQTFKLLEILHIILQITRKIINYNKKNNELKKNLWKVFYRMLYNFHNRNFYYSVILFLI